VDTVKVRKDPKGGWLGPNLRDVYLHGEDSPAVFCGSGPEIPTGEIVSVFSTERPSTPQSSGCEQIFAVAKGIAIWDGEARKTITKEELRAKGIAIADPYVHGLSDGKAGKTVTEGELQMKAQQEEHLVGQWYDIIGASLPSAWHQIRPVGPPCTDTSGSPDAVRKRYEGQKCSIAIEYPDSPYQPSILFVNWMVTGLLKREEWDPNPPVMPETAFAYVRSNHGDRYAITQSYRTSDQTPAAANVPSNAETDSSAHVQVGVSVMPMRDGKIVGRSNLAELQIRDTGYFIGSFPLQKWLAQYGDAPVFFDGDGAYNRLDTHQKSLAQDFCRQGLKIYEEPSNPDLPAVNICKK